MSPSMSRHGLPGDTAMLSINAPVPIVPMRVAAPVGNEIEYSPEDSESVRRAVEIINERILGPQDLRLILRRS